MFNPFGGELDVEDLCYISNGMPKHSYSNQMYNTYKDQKV
jgi:hypothetical protein